MNGFQFYKNQSKRHWAGLLHNPFESLTENEWKILPEIVNILKPFKELTEEMSSEQSITISKVLAANNCISSVLDKIRLELKTDESKMLMNKILIEFNNRFKNSARNLILAKAALLDPRFKKQAFKEDTLSYEHAKNSLRNELENLAHEENLQNEIEFATSSPFANSQTCNETSIWDFDQRILNESTTSNMAKSIITMRQYTEEKLIAKSENPLKWWTEQKMLYPELAKLAIKYLCDGHFSTVRKIFFEI